MTIFNYVRKHTFISSALAVILITIGIIAGRLATVKPAINTSPEIKKVTLVDVSSFRKDSLNVSADGVVESRAQADLKSQMSAPVSIINVNIGDTVYTGQVILELQNTDVRAQLSQALASLDLAKGQQTTGSASLESTKQSAIDKIRDSYIKCYDTIYSQIDNILYNNDGSGGRLQSYITDNKLNSEITDIDIDMKMKLRDWKTINDSLSTSSDTGTIKIAIALAQQNLSRTDILLGDMLQIINDSSRYATPSFAISLNGWKTITSGARANISGAAQSLTGADMALSTSNISQSSTVAAQVSIAEAGVQNLQAQLAKTIIRSPINGKIAALPLHIGELASPGQLLSTVVGNDDGLKIKAFASGEDLSRIKIGAAVLIDGSIKGTVANVAPSVNSTNRKVEIDIAVNDPANSKLIIGQNVSASITAAKVSTLTENNTSTNNSFSIYTLPIQDVKIIPGAAYVYTVGADSKIVRNEVTLGDVQGDFIEVTKGLTDDMRIITPVYELDEGQTVTVQ